MTRYGYQDMPEEYSDISHWVVEARCYTCGRITGAIQEDCWKEQGKLVCDCGCSELSAYREK